MKAEIKQSRIAVTRQVVVSMPRCCQRLFNGIHTQLSGNTHS